MNTECCTNGWRLYDKAGETFAEPCLTHKPNERFRYERGQLTQGWLAARQPDRTAAKDRKVSDALERYKGDS